MSEENQENHLTPLEMELLNSIINQFKTPDEKPVEEDLSKITYNDYYKSQGINYIKRNISLNDSLLDPFFEVMAQNIKTPLEEWNDRFQQVTPYRNDRFGETKTLFVYESNINY